MLPKKRLERKGERGINLRIRKKSQEEKQKGYVQSHMSMTKGERRGLETAFAHLVGHGAMHQGK
jgi:hypothetical protein